MCDVLVLNKDGCPISSLPLSVISWQNAFKLLCQEKVRVIKNYDNWAVKTYNQSISVPSIVMTVDYIKYNRSVAYSRGNIYLRDEFKCQYCLDKFDTKDLTLDHVVPKSLGGKNSWTNVVAACKKCNHHKGNDISIRPAKTPHRPTYYELVSKRQKHPIKIKDSEWTNFINWDKNHIIMENVK